MDTNEFKKELLKYEEKLREKIENDNKLFDQDIEININEILERINANNVYENNNSYGVIYNGNPEITLYLSIKAILLEKNIIFLLEDDFFKDSNQYIISIFEEFIKKNKLKSVIKIYFNCQENKIIESSKFCDEMIYIRNKSNYAYINEQCNRKVRYNGFNCIYLYYESSDKTYELLSDIYVACMERDIIMEKFTDDVEDDIYVMNLNSENYAIIILTEDEEKINKLKNEVKAQYKYVNENPFKFNKYHFECDI